MELALSTTATGTTLATLGQRTAEYVQAAKAPATIKAYRADWEHFDNWCQAQGLESLPATPQTVSLYLTAFAATLAAATLGRRIVAINKVHRAFGHEAPAAMTNPLIGETVKGIHRVHGTAQDRKAPLLSSDLRTIIQQLPATLAGIRDRAILLLGFAGGFRRSELAALQVEDVAFGAEGLLVTLRRSKTDQEGAGRQVAIPFGQGDTCPVAAVAAWIKIAESGPLFRGIDQYGKVGESLHAASIGQIVKRVVEAAGLDPDLYGGHSLRAGLCTEAFRNGARELDIMRQTGHRSVSTLRRYVRDAALFRNNVGGMVGL
jgi:site-specific recombinase XerD